MLPCKNEADAFVRRFNNALAHLLLAELQLDLQLAVADDKLFCRRQSYRQRIVSQAADDVVGSRQM